MNVLLWHKDTMSGRRGISAQQRLVCFLKHGRLFMLFKCREGVRPRNNSLQTQTAPYAIAAMKTIVRDTAWFFFLLSFFSQLKRLKWFSFSGVFMLSSPCINRVIWPLCAIFGWWESVLLYARRSDWLMGGRRSAELTIKGPAVIHNPITSRSTPKPGNRTTTMARFGSFFWQVCISLIDWHHRKSFIKTQISSVIIVIVTHKGTRTLLFLVTGNQGCLTHFLKSEILYFQFLLTLVFVKLPLFFFLLQERSIYSERPHDRSRRDKYSNHFSQ